MRVVQFGEGVFLRGFTDWMIHRLNTEAGTDIHITIVQPRDSDSVARLMEQGGNYTVVQQGLIQGTKRSEQYVIRCIDSGLNTHTDPDAFIRLAGDPEVEVVISNTTEAGIAWSEEDAALGEQRTLVRSFPGKLTWFLAERYAQQPKTKSLHVLPCELIADNGQQLQALVTRMAEAWHLGPGFLDWLKKTVIFYDTLVDRIVPGSPATSHPLMVDGQEDRFPVQVEWFHSWYIRGPRTLLQTLPLDLLDFNVRFVDDLRPYRALKVRVLNGLHTAMATTGAAAGIESVAEAVDDEALGPWLKALLAEEIAPTIDLPEAEVESFAAATWDRFRNPFIHHRLRSILLNSSAKIPARLGEIVRELERDGASSPRIAEAVAAWLILTRDDRELADSPSALSKMGAMWDEFASGSLSVEELAGRALTDPEILGSVDWPRSFTADVATALIGRGPLET